MRIIGRLLLLLVLCLVVLHACYYPWTLVREGLEMVGNHYSSYGVDGDLFFDKREININTVTAFLDMRALNQLYLNWLNEH